MARRNRCRCNHSPRGGGQNRKKMKILNRYSKPNSRRHEPGCGRIRGVPPGYIFLFAASCLAMSSCTWEEFPDEPAVLQKPVALSFATAVETAPEADTRVIRPGTDFGGNAYFPVGKYAIGIHLYNLNGSEVFEGSDNMQGLMEITGTGTGTGTDNDEWKYWNSQGTPVTPKGFPGTRIRRMAYTPYDPKATIDSIPFDFTNKVNVEPQYGQANLLLCSTGETDIPADPLANPIQLRFKNAYTKVVLRITKKEDKNDNQNIGKVTETAIDNLTAEWIKNRGGIDPATGYVKPTSEPGKIWNDSTAMLTTIEPVEFTFLVPAFMAQKEPAQHRRRCRPQHHIRIRIEQDQHLQPRIQQFAAVSVVPKLELRRCERRLRPNRREQPDVLVRPEFGANSSSGNRILFSNPISANSRTFRNLRTELPQGSHGRSVCNVR